MAYGKSTQLGRLKWIKLTELWTDQIAFPNLKNASFFGANNLAFIEIQSD